MDIIKALGKERLISDPWNDTSEDSTEQCSHQEAGNIPTIIPQSSDSTLQRMVCPKLFMSVLGLDTVFISFPVTIIKLF